MKYYAIIVAGGTGNRMKSAIAKQFLLLNGLPVLMHTIEAFSKCTLNPEIILVLNIHQHNYWAELCEHYHFDIPHQVVKGGEQRFHSVKNGLKLIKGKGVVAIHDAVRPLISPDLIAQSYKQAASGKNCVLGISPTDSVRKVISPLKNEALNRNDLLLVQTPQTFRVDVLKKAYQKPYRNDFTDDASVVEHSGFDISFIEGARENIKITYQEDLEIAAIFLKKRGLDE